MNNRKRKRSVVEDFRSPSKCFVSQRMVDSLDQKYMKTIFGKCHVSDEKENTFKVHLFIVQIKLWVYSLMEPKTIQTTILRLNVKKRNLKPFG